MQTRRKFLGTIATAFLAARALDGRQLERALIEEVPQIEETVLVVRPLSAIDEAIKNYYLPAMREQLNRPSILLEGVEWS